MPIKKKQQQTEGVCLEINHLRTYMADPKTNTKTPELTLCCSTVFQQKEHITIWVAF